MTTPPTSPLIGLVAPHDYERWMWEQTLRQAGLALLVCQVDRMAGLRPAAWVVAPPVHAPPDRSLAAVRLTAPSLIITPWLAETQRLVSAYQHVNPPVMVVYPDHARRDVRRYLSLLAHAHSGVLTVPAHRHGGRA